MNQRIVAFIDILGFKQQTEDLQEKSLLDIISPLYFAEVSNYGQKKIYQDVGLGKLHTTEMTFFSDSIVISCDTNQVSDLILHIKKLSENFIEYGLFLRGGITLGKLYHNERIVFGPAMNEAYLLESGFAVYPRIIISDTVYSLIKSTTEPAVSEEVYKTLQSISQLNEDLKTINNISRDEDGFYYINPFPLSIALTAHVTSLGITSLDDFINYLKACIEKNLQKHMNNKKIFSKYFWLASKFNRYYTSNTDIGIIEI